MLIIGPREVMAMIETRERKYRELCWALKEMGRVRRTWWLLGQASSGINISELLKHLKCTSINGAI